MALTGTKTYQNFIGGEWVDASSDETFESTNPATGDVIWLRRRRRTRKIPRTRDLTR